MTHNCITLHFKQQMASIANGRMSPELQVGKLTAVQSLYNMSYYCLIVLMLLCARQQFFSHVRDDLLTSCVEPVLSSR